MKNLWLKIRLKLIDINCGKGLINEGESLFPDGEDIYTNFKHGMPWGFIHPDTPWNGVGYNGIGIEEKKGDLVLSCEKYYGNIVHRDIVYSPSIVSGCIYSKEKFLYGKFEMTFIIPKSGKTLPALWLVGVDSWPPEVDIFEYFSDTDKKGRKKLSTNIYYTTGGDKSRSYRVGGAGDLAKVGLKWTKNELSWYYNGILFREEKVKIKGRMRLIINTGITEDYKTKDLKDKLIIKSIKYVP